MRNRGEHTPHSIHSSWQEGGEGTSIVSLNTFSYRWLPRNRTHLKVFQQMRMSFECEKQKTKPKKKEKKPKKHSYVICSHCAPHTLAPKPRLRDTSCPVKNLHYAPPSLCTLARLFSLILAFHASAPPASPHKVSKVQTAFWFHSTALRSQRWETPWNKE